MGRLRWIIIVVACSAGCAQAPVAAPRVASFESELCAFQYQNCLGLHLSDGYCRQNASTLCGLLTGAPAAAAPAAVGAAVSFQPVQPPAPPARPTVCFFSRDAMICP